MCSSISLCLLFKKKKNTLDGTRWWLNVQEQRSSSSSSEVRRGRVATGLRIMPGGVIGVSDISKSEQRMCLTKPIKTCTNPALHILIRASTDSLNSHRMGHLHHD